MSVNPYDQIRLGWFEDFPDDIDDLELNVDERQSWRRDQTLVSYIWSVERSALCGEKEITLSEGTRKYIMQSGEQLNETATKQLNLEILENLKIRLVQFKPLKNMISTIFTDIDDEETMRMTKEKAVNPHHPYPHEIASNGPRY